MTFTVDDYERAIARIFDQNNNVIGTGFLVAPGYVVTCAHVVLQAIGVTKDKFATYPGQPSEYISLDFHVLASDQEIKAQVVDWLPYSLHSGDVASLKLLTPEPNGAKPIPLEEMELSAVENDRHSVYGFGKSPTGGRSDAYRPKSNVAGGRFQLCKFDDPKDETIKPGFSGAPVWNEQHKCVIGMVATAAEAQEVAYAISTKVLQVVLQKIKARCLDDVLTQSLSCLNEQDRHHLELAINAALRYCNPNGVDRSWLDQFLDLSTDRAPVAGWETVGRLVRFAMIVVKIDGIRENTFYALRSWVEDLCRFDFKSLLLQITEEMIANQEIPSSTIYQHLMVVVEETEILTDEMWVSIWPVSDRNTYKPENPPQPTVANEILRLAELPAFIREQIRKNFRKEPTPTIHLFLPRKLFGCDVEMRSCGSSVDVLGSKYEFVIRTNLATHPINYQSYYDDWITKWQKIEAGLEQQTSQLFKHVDCAQPKEHLMREIASINGAMLKNWHSWDSVGEIFGLIGDDDIALPVAVWSRDQQLQNNLADLHCVVKTLQDRVRQERSAAHESASQDLLGHHLSLLWEDPKVLPPGMLDVDQDGMLRI